MFVENTYIVADPESGDAVMIDPGEEATRLLPMVRSKSWTLRAIWLTHAHIDHVAGINDVRSHLELPIWLHPADRPLYDRVEAQGAAFGLSMSRLPDPDVELAEG